MIRHSDKLMQFIRVHLISTFSILSFLFLQNVIALKIYSMKFLSYYYVYNK